MRAATKLVAVVLALTCAACASSSSAKSPAASGVHASVDATKEGRRLTSLFYEGKVTDVWARMNAEMRRLVGSEARLATLRHTIETEFGSEDAVMEEKTRDFFIANGPATPSQGYLRVARFSKATQAIAIEWAFDPSGQVSAFSIKPIRY